jgi:glycosyltransferase involved in cell wall biosynthesis
MLAVIETHPIQYHAPVYRAVQQQFGIPVTAIYGSDFSVVGYRDAEFASTFAWDTDLLSGYGWRFLNNRRDGSANSADPVSTRGLHQALVELRPRAILLVGYSPRFHQLALLQAWRSRRPLLFRAETTDHAVRRRQLKTWFRDRALRWIYNRCDRLLYVGQRSKRHFQRLGCSDAKLVFSPYCVDTTPFAVDEADRRRMRHTMRSEMRIPPEDKVFLLSGKLVRRKRPDLVLSAIRELPPSTRERIHVLVLGSGDQQSEIEALAQASPPVTVTCIGFQNQTRLSAYYHAADLLVLPSESRETWGLVVNEALHHGLPCVVSDAVGSAPDLIKPGLTGAIFDAGSPESLASAIDQAWPLMDCPTVRHQCRQVVSDYTVAKAAEGIARAYEAVIDGT